VVVASGHLDVFYFGGFFSFFAQKNGARTKPLDVRTMLQSTAR
jgi:hypothetical protein